MGECVGGGVEHEFSVRPRPSQTKDRKLGSLDNIIECCIKS